MKKYLGKKKILASKKRMVTVREAADILDVTPPTVVKMYKKGMESIAVMRAYRKKLATMPRGGGAKAKVHNTSKGPMTIHEIAKRHKYGLSQSTLNYRAQKWGFDHKSLWLEKMAGLNFYKVAVKLDGPPRGKDAKKVGQERVSIDNRVIYEQGINRTKCCFRGHGLHLKKCKTYKKRIEMTEGYPDECSVATGNCCSNYAGESC